MLGILVKTGMYLLYKLSLKQNGGIQSCLKESSYRNGKAKSLDTVILFLPQSKNKMVLGLQVKNTWEGPCCAILGRSGSPFTYPSRKAQTVTESGQAGVMVACFIHSANIIEHQLYA